MRFVLLGWWWAGVSAVWLLLRDCGYEVVAVDKQQSQTLARLDAHGAEIVIGHGQVEIQSSDTLIYSDAVVWCAELEEWRSLGATVYRYGEFIGELSARMTTVAIAGTHGKSTSTSLMIDALFHTSGRFAVGIVWALLPSYDNKNCVIASAHKGSVATIVEDIIGGKAPEKSDLLFVIEADEYSRKFLELSPDYALITNIDHDHTDIYPTFDYYKEVFHDFISKISTKCFVHDDEYKYLIEKYPSILMKTPFREFEFEHLIGIHNQLNAQLVYAVACELCNWNKNKEILERIMAFPWLWRRMEYLWQGDWWATIYTDYGHHPVEIETVLRWMRSAWPDKKICAIVEPHEIRRLLENRETFAPLRKLADDFSYYQIYKARESIDDVVGALGGTICDEAQNVVQWVTDMVAVEDRINAIWYEYSEKYADKYIEDEKEIKTIINQYSDEYSIVFFSAWVLDGKVRGAMDL